MRSHGAALVAAAALTALYPLASDAAQVVPPPPELPDIIARDDAGQVTIRAVRLDAPLRIDGELDEAIYGAIRPASDFVQTDPIEGVPATEKTDVWVFFDGENLYVAARMWETDPDRIIVSDMRRDGALVYQGATRSRSSWTRFMTGATERRS